MANLKELLRKRRSKFYEGAELDTKCAEFMEMFAKGAIVHDFGETIIVAEPYGMAGNVRAWLLFDKFTIRTARDIEKFSNLYPKGNIYASTHDERIAKMLIKFGFDQYAKDDHDCYLVKRKVM